MGANSEMVPRPVRLGVIGTGLAVEQLHWPPLQKMTDRFQFVAFCNHTRPKAEHFAQYTGSSMDDFYEDYHDLLKRDDVEAVLISLPIALNLEVTRACLEAGKHVICEKPLGIDEEEGWAYVELEKAYPNLKLLVAENFFYRDDLRLAQTLLQDGAIGTQHFMTWRMASQLIPVPGTFSSTPWRHKPKHRGGLLLDGGVHWTAQIRMLCGEVNQVQGEIQQVNSTIDAPSDITLNLRFASSAVGNFSATYPEIPVPAEANEMRIYGTEGVMIVGRHYLTIHRPDGSVEEHRFTGIDGGYYGEFLNFYEAIVHDAPIIGTADQSLRNMLIILRGLDSGEQGGVFSLEDLPQDGPQAGVPLWKPLGASGLFDGLPGEYSTSTRQQSGS